MDKIYRYNEEEVKTFSDKTLQRLNAEKLPTTPPLFELFFNYYSGDTPEVTRSIDMMAAQNFELTPDRCYALHVKFFNNEASQAALEKADDIIGSTLSNVDGMVRDVTISNANFNDAVGGIPDNIDDIDDDQLRETLSSMIVQTQKIASENKALEDKLKQSSQTMKDLKIEMEMVREQAYTDPLTGLANRKKFDKEIEYLVASARKDDKPISILFSDIDHFKNFNDTYGHHIGDHVLKIVAKVFKDTLKGRDFVCRYGGEEFVIILPETNQFGATKIGDILRESIKTKKITHKQSGQVITNITISGGVALLRDNEDIKDWIKRADDALYQAKNEGRNRIVVSPEWE